MYLRKTFMKGFIMTFGGIILSVLAILFCFTELPIPGFVYIVAWMSCIFIIVTGVSKIGEEQ